MMENEFRRIVREELVKFKEEFKHEAKLKKYLNVKETADYLCCSVQKVRGLYNDGTLEGSRIAGNIIFDINVIEKYINKNKNVVEITH